MLGSGIDWHTLFHPRQKGKLAIIHEMALASANCFSERAASFAALLDSTVMSRIPNSTPIFLRKAWGGSPPAKIQTKSLGISCNSPLTSITRESFLNSTGIELNSFVSNQPKLCVVANMASSSRLDTPSFSKMLLR